MKLSHRRRARAMLVQALYAWQISEETPARVYGSMVLMEDTTKVDLAYFEESFMAITKATEEYTPAIEAAAARPMKEISPIEKAILWIGCYELKSRVEIPYRVVINEAIEQAKNFGATESHKFINTVMDKLSKEWRSLER